jgi:hypothetical protein
VAAEQEFEAAAPIPTSTKLDEVEDQAMTVVETVAEWTSPSQSAR